MTVALLSCNQDAPCTVGTCLLAMKSEHRFEPLYVVIDPKPKKRGSSFLSFRTASVILNRKTLKGVLHLRAVSDASG